MDDIMRSMSILEQLIPMTNQMTLPGVGSLICMIAEEWCKAQQEDVTVLMHNLSDMVDEVNATEGRY